MMLFLNAVWALTTSLWSEAFDLSMSKSLALFLTSFSFYIAGIYWGESARWGHLFDFLAPVAMVTFASSLLGYFFSPAAFNGFMFQGFVGGSNMLGLLVFVSLPAILWKFYKMPAGSANKKLYVSAAALMLFFLYLTYSRSSMLAAGCVIGSFMYVVSLKRTLTLAYLLLFLLLITYAFRYEYLEAIIRETVFKKSDSVLFSRAQTWEESLEQARKGGLLGGGYGVTIGYDAWAGGLTAVGYGREKGSSQLAIAEETGLVGLFFYSVLMVSVISSLVMSLKAAREIDTRVALSLCLGVVTGLFLNSCFEGWWVAPGSFEYVAFWSVAGVGSGISSATNSARLD